MTLKKHHDDLPVQQLGSAHFDDSGVEHGLTDVETASEEHASTPFALSIDDAIYDLIELLDS
jgi:hypothetical protein